MSTPRAAGAAVSPPAPSRTSITQTAIRGVRAGANAANQASVSSVRLAWSWQLSGTGDLAARSSGAGGHFWVVSSSAVPVLPATSTPGICACTPVPSRTTPTIRRADGVGHLRRVTRCVARGRGRAGSARVSFGALPASAIVDATFTICSVVACTRPWPIADEPTARSSPMSPAAGIVLVAAPGMPGWWLKPKRSAMFTSRLAPELGAERGEDRVARDRERLRERPAAALPVGVVELDAAQRRGGRVGEGRLRRGQLASSAPVSVTIFIVEPGGCRPPRTRCRRTRGSRRCAGARATTPPRRPARAAIAARSTAGEIVVRTARAGLGLLRPARRAAGQQVAAGAAADALLQEALAAR